MLQTSQLSRDERRATKHELHGNTEQLAECMQLAERMQLAECVAPAIVLVHAQPLIELEYEHVSQGV
jgi:hypothetical protein